ncbi:unnamed protein product [Cylicocyclus nassatus]|uniref:Headcase N-terminal domain-containing protein n=1 Tax=Cylicocyclus nassatus TaxID=53992 RepID=A0AA36DMX0_CYLNA|nr:unnamed protein product [Cylicocyclus nassatus]
MECSNEKCPFADVLLHQECFDAFEDHLVKVLSNLGSARGWTDAQRRANLWEKKGQSLVAKVCRCRCGLGMTRLDRLAADDRSKRKVREVEQAQREAALAAGLRTLPQKKKHRARNALPKLNFGGLMKAPPPSKAYMEDVHESWTSLRQQGSTHRDRSSSSFCSSLTNQQSRRESSTYASDAWGLLPSFSSDTRAQSVMSGHFADQDDSISTSSKDFAASSNSIDMLSMPVSYASVMKNGAALQFGSSQVSSPYVATPLSVQTDLLVSDSGVEMKSRSTTSSEFSELTSVKDLSSPVKEDAANLPLLGFGGSEDELAAKLVDFDSLSRRGFEEQDDLRQLSPTAVLPDTLLPLECPCSGPTVNDCTSLPEWHLFNGTSFALGESVVANTFLPIWKSQQTFELPEISSLISSLKLKLVATR